MSITIRRLEPGAIHLLHEIDRSEHIESLYSVEHGELVASEVDIRVPPWDPEGSGDHSAGRLIDRWRPQVEAGAALLGAFVGGEFRGLAVVDTALEPGLAWLCLLHVTNAHRRTGVASALWAEAVRLARRAGAESMYVSATPSSSAVGFYLSRGCEVADPPREELFAEEPEDVHLICPLAPAGRGASA